MSKIFTDQPVITENPNHDLQKRSNLEEGVPQQNQAGSDAGASSSSPFVAGAKALDGQEGPLKESDWEMNSEKVSSPAVIAAKYKLKKDKSK